MGIFYCTREDVSSALDSKLTARNSSQIDREIEAASRGIEGLLHRKFAPVLATRYFDWPNDQFGSSYRVWFNQHEVISLDLVLSGGTPLSASDYFLEPVNEGPPFNRLEVDLASSASFDSGGTHQRDIALTGLFGYDDVSAPAGALNGGVDASVAVVTVTDASLVGVGTVLRVGTERMAVTDRGMSTTGQTLQTPLAASAADVTVAVADGTKVHTGEVVLLDSERMFVVDVAGNNLTVKRAWDGSVLAPHTSSTIYALRRLTVQRNVLGTTPATHSDGAACTSWVVPGPVRQLCIAEVLNTFEQESSGYARTIGSGDNTRNASGAGIADIRDTTYTSHGRKARKAVV